MATAKIEVGELTELDVIRFGELFQVGKSCWLWRAGKTKTGYGKFSFVRRNERSKKKVTKMAHHAAFYIANGRWPAAGRLVMHSCDNPSCVNPAHLIEGTPKQNSADMIAKGRQARGTKLHTNKLSERDVLEIRKANELGVPIWFLSQAFGVTNGNIYHIISRSIWRHLDDREH